MNNEDIKLIENFIRIYKELDEKTTDFYFNKAEIPIKIIENLIKEYKELEKDKRRLYRGINELKEQILENVKTLADVGINYIHKDKIKEILGIEEDIPTERILSLLETLISEVDRLEDIEDKKVQVEVKNIERKRDKYWKDKIKEKIKKLEKEYKEYENTNEWEIFDETKYAYDLLKELLEGENKQKWN